MRLIDADKICLTNFEVFMCNGDYKQALSMLIDKIENAPTAYDMDKVVGELEELRDRFTKEDFHIRGIIEKTIEIVKAGGTNE